MHTHCLVKNTHSYLNALQDDILVKTLRVAGIGDMAAAANVFPSPYLAEYTLYLSKITIING